MGTRLRRPTDSSFDDPGARRAASSTAVAVEALRTGVLPLASRRGRDEVPGEAALLSGDLDEHALEVEYVGEGTPGGNNPTPDQSDVDEIGRAYGLQEEDSGALRSAFEVLDRRDRHRQELAPPVHPPRSR